MISLAGAGGGGEEGGGEWGELDGGGGRGEGLRKAGYSLGWGGEHNTTKQHNGIIQQNTTGEGWGELYDEGGGEGGGGGMWGGVIDLSIGAIGMCFMGLIIREGGD